MRLDSLTIKNFRVLKSIHLDFGDGVTAIIGLNGAGKSSIVEAVSWVLYGNQAARSGKNEIKSAFAPPQESCSVSLDFNINGEKYRVTRQLVGKSERPEVQLFRGDSSESIGVNETQRYVGELLGLDWRGFLTSFLARQQELNALSDLQPAKRREHLAGMLGVTRLDRIITQTKQDIRVNREKTELLERQVTQVDVVNSRIKELNAAIAELSKKSDQLTAAVSEKETSAKKAARDLEQVQETRSTWLQLQARLEASVKSEAALQEQAAELNKELRILAENKKEIQVLSDQLKPYEELKAESEALARMKNEQELVNRLKRQRSNLEKELHEAVRELEQTETEESSIQQESSGIPADISQQLSRKKTDLDKARQQFTRVKAQKEILSADIARLTKQMSSISEFGPDSVCDRCLRPLGSDLPDIKRHLTQELSQLGSQRRTVAQDLKVIKDQGTALKKETEELEAVSIRRGELDIRLKAVRKEKRTLQNRHKNLTDSLASVDNELKEKGAVSFDQNRYESLTGRLQELDTARLRLSTLQGIVGSEPEKREKLLRCQNSIAVAAEEAEGLKKKLAHLDYSDDRFQRISTAFKEAQSQLEGAKNERVACRTKLEVSRNELEVQTGLLDRLNQAGRQLEELRQDRYYGEKLSRLFTEFREFLISRIRPTLSSFSSTLISEMTDGKYTFVDLDEKYNLRIMDTDEYFGIDRFSGGEKDLANLCLRLAISLALTEAAGLSRSFVILDEVFGSQDDTRKDLIIKALTNLKERFPQILLITHVEDVKDRVDGLVFVEPTGMGWSEVRNGSSG